METLKKLKKHNHSLTDILKVFLFSLVMLAPCFAILTKCLYVINNKNAYESYYANEINETTIENGYNGNDKYYTLVIREITYTTQTEFIVNNFTSQYLPLNQIDTNVKGFILYVSGGANYVRINYNDNTTQYVYVSSQSMLATMSFYIVSKDNNTYDSYLTYKTINHYSFLDNAFYYAIEEIKNQNLFNWTKDTAIYTGVNAMCTGLAVQDGALPILITYWTLMTAIYIILDIVIFVFKKITHFMQ